MTKKPITQGQSISQWFVYAFAFTALIIVPFWFYKPAVDVTLVPKFMLLSGLILLAMLYFFFSKGFSTILTRLFTIWPVRLWTGFIIISLLSLFFAINPSEGVFDVMRLITSLLFLMVTTTIISRSKSINPFIYSSIVLALLFSLIGLYEYFDYAFRQVDLSALYEIKGLMSHKNAFSVVLLMTIPFSSYAVLTFKSTTRVVAILTLFLSLTTLFLLQTRSVWLALMVFLITCSGFFLLSWKALTQNSKKALTRYMLLTMAVIAVAFLVAFSINRYSITHPVTTDLPPGNEMIESLELRVASIFDTSSPNRVKRLDIWLRTFEIFRDHPVIGVGAGNWKIVVPAYYQPDPDESYYHNWRRPHNDYLWVLAEKGIIGFLFYLGFFFSVLYMALQKIKQPVSANHKYLTIFAVAGLGAYCTDAMFSFPYERIDLQMFMMLMVAVIILPSETPNLQKSKNPALKRSKGGFPKPLIVVSMLVLVVGMVIGQKMIQAEKNIKDAKFFLDNKQWANAVAAADLAIDAWPQLDPVNNPLIWYRGHANMNLGHYTEAKNDLYNALRSNPNSIPALSDLAVVYYLTGDYEKAEELLVRALKIYPMNRMALRVLGLTYFQMERYQEAAECYYRCITDQPNPELDALIEEVSRKLYGE